MRQALAAGALLVVIAAPAAYFLDDGSIRHPFRHTASVAAPVEVHAAPLSAKDLMSMSRGVKGLAATMKDEMPATASSANDAPVWLAGGKVSAAAERLAALASVSEPDIGILAGTPPSSPEVAPTGAAANPVSPASSLWDRTTAVLEDYTAGAPAAVKTRAAGVAPRAAVAGNDRVTADWHDLVETYLWTLRAAGRGDTGAALDLARMYDEGLGVAYRPAEARRWFAAARGLAAADQRSDAAIPGGAVAAARTAEEPEFAPPKVGAAEGLVALTEPTDALSDLQ